MSDQEVQGMLIQLEATTAQLRRELASADSVVAKTTQSIDRNLAQVDSAFDRTAQGAQQAGTLIRGAFAAIAGAGLVGSIIHQVDAYGQIADRMKAATGSVEEYIQVQQHLLRTAQETYRPLAEAQELYIRTADVMRSLGFDTQQTLDITDSFSFLLVTNAASADKAQSALGAYSKALQTGKVEADGWVSIQEAMPTIVNAIATATGKSAEQIRKLGVEGKLSLDDINTGLLSQPQGSGRYVGQRAGRPGQHPERPRRFLWPHGGEHRRGGWLGQCHQPRRRQHRRGCRRDGGCGRFGADGIRRPRRARDQNRPG